MNDLGLGGVLFDTLAFQEWKAVEYVESCFVQKRFEALKHCFDFKKTDFVVLRTAHVVAVTNTPTI